MLTNEQLGVTGSIVDDSAWLDVKIMHMFVRSGSAADTTVSGDGDME